MPLFAKRFQNDPRTQEAKKLLFAALHDAQKDICEIKPADAELAKDYETMISEFSKIRGFPLFYPYIGSGIGHGPLVELADGSIKYDLISGIGVHYFGHSHPDLLLAALDGAMSNTIMQGNLQQNCESLELSALLCSLSGLDHAFLTTSGAMAGENALKMTFQKKQPASRILAFDRCFAGRTLALSYVTDKPMFREGLPQTICVDYIPFYNETNPEASVDALKKHLARYPGQHALMCMELVQGEGGFWVGNSQFFKEIISILKQHNVAVWIDEVQTFARTQELFAFHYFGLEGLVDIVTIGKAAQVCATLYTKNICPKPNLISQTFTSSSTAIAASKFIIETAMQKAFFGPDGKIIELHNAFVSGLERLSTKYDIKGPFGIGAMIACTIFDGDAEKTRTFIQRLFHNGVIAFIAGSSRIRFLLPVGALDTSHIDPIMKILEETLKECS